MVRFQLRKAELKQVAARTCKALFLRGENFLSPSLIEWVKACPLGPLLQDVRRAAFRSTHIYPIRIPKVSIQPNLDMVLMELPPRYIPMMPNGLGYVHNILMKTGIRFQTIDLNIQTYHWFHSQRLLFQRKETLPSGYALSEDPWDNTNTHEWERADVVQFFFDWLEPFVFELVQKRPRIIGISVQANSRNLANRLIQRLRRDVPEALILVGGYDCKYHDIGPHLVPDFDYMAIGDTELTMQPLISRLLQGERPKDVRGFVSRFDSPQRVWLPTPELKELDQIEFPRYEWTDPTLYRTFAGHYLLPITSTRGCSWSKCKFCAETFAFRRRSPKDVCDEIEYWMRQRGFPPIFHFNDSDLVYDMKVRVSGFSFFVPYF